MLGAGRRKSLTIVHVISSLGVGGMERVVLQLADAQKRNGHRVTVLSLKGGPLEEEARGRQLRVRVLRGGKIGRAAQTLRHFFSERPDIVHVHNPTSLHYGVLSKAVSRAAVVVTLHGDQDTHARLGTRLEWRMVSSAIVVSAAAEHTLRLPDSAGPFTVVRNGIPPVVVDGEASKAFREGLNAAGRAVGVMVARIDGRKGHLTLLESLKIVRDAGTDLLMMFAGDGKERGHIEHHAATLGLGPEVVRFLGRRSDVDLLLSAADFFVLPSDIEGLPMSVLEAMAHGLPVVASRVGGIPELLEHDRQGLLVPPGDAPALAEAIVRVVSDAGLRRRLGDAGRQRAITEFSLDATTERYQQLYERALGGPA
jgi:L-malate glycosyltransferase